MNALLHVCCGPCASGALPRFREERPDCGVSLYFSNSNINTAEEFNLRLEQARRLAAADGADIAVDPYDHDSWLRDAAAGHECDPEKGMRCARCFLFSMRRAAAYAASHGYAAFTTSLTISPHKISSMVFEAGRAAAREHGVDFLEIDFKKKNGFLRSLERSAVLGLYRQSWCGCEFSLSAGARA